MGAYALPWHWQQHPIPHLKEVTLPFENGEEGAGMAVPQVKLPCLSLRVPDHHRLTPFVRSVTVTRMVQMVVF